MKYYLISQQLAETLNVTAFRHGGKDGYVVTSADLAPFGIDKAIEDGATSMTEKKAIEYIKNLKK